MRRYNDDMDKMQQEAVRRMQEMQNRGKPVSSQEKSNSQKKPPESVMQSPVHTSNNTAENEKISVKEPTHQKSFIDLLMHDKERSIILMLILLLSTEKTDAGLILALIYLLI